jgi:hypothetical protein
LVIEARRLDIQHTKHNLNAKSPDPCYATTQDRSPAARAA